MQRKGVILHTWCVKADFLNIYSSGNYVSLNLPVMLLRRDLPCTSIDLSAVTPRKPHITIAKEVPSLSRGHHCELMGCLQDHIDAQEDEYMELQFDRLPHKHAGAMMFLTNHCTLATLLEDLRGIVEEFILRVAPELITDLNFSPPHVTLVVEDVVVPVVFTEKREEYRWHLQHSPDMQSYWWLDWLNEKIYFNVNIHDANLSYWSDPLTGLRYEYDKRTRNARFLVDEESCDVIEIPYHYNLQRQWPIARR